jgi:uncharacterized membrane protein
MGRAARAVALLRHLRGQFLIFGIICVNHHAVMARIRNVNRRLLFMNLVFLMIVALIPFPTALLADYLQVGHDERLAAAVYSGTMALIGVSFGGIWAYAVLSNDLLLHEGVDTDRARRSLWIFAAGAPLYVLAIAVSLISAMLALAINALLALFYLFDVLPPLSRPEIAPGDADGDREGGPSQKMETR